MLKKESELKNKITLKGKLVSVGETEIEVEDDKSGEIDSLKFSDFDMFIGKSINVVIADSVKKDITEEKEDEE